MNKSDPETAWGKMNTEEKQDAIAPLLGLGWSAAMVAAEIEGCSRNAVIGIVHRSRGKLRLAVKPSSPTVRKAKATPRPRPNPRPRPRPAAKGKIILPHDYRLTSAEDALPPTPLPPVEFIPEERRLKLVQLTEHTCKWPVGDPQSSEFHFCGDYSEDGSPYCSIHRRRARRQAA